MLEKVKQYALEKYAGDETLAEHFVEGFLKQASQNAPKTTAQMFSEGLTGAVGKGIGGLAVGLGVHGLNQALASVANGSLHTQFLEALAKAISMNPQLREQKKERVAQYAETIFKFAPHVACDPNLLSSILANAVQGHEGAGLDVMTIKTLGDLESRYIENRGSVTFSPKTYV